MRLELGSLEHRRGPRRKVAWLAGKRRHHLGRVASLEALGCLGRCSIVVSIPACHAGDPGSIPGNGASKSFSSAPYSVHVQILLFLDGPLPKAPRIGPTISDALTTPCLSPCIRVLHMFGDTHVVLRSYCEYSSFEHGVCVDAPTNKTSMPYVWSSPFEAR